MSECRKSGCGAPLLILVGLSGLLALAKLLDIIDLEWGLVLAPIWFPTGLYVAAACAVGSM